MEVWCLLIDHEKKAASGNPFSVIVGPNARIQDLTEKVKEKRTNALEHVDAADLTVWRCMDPKLLAEVDLEQQRNDLSNVDFTDRTKTKIVAIRQKITTLGLSDAEILLIEVPEPQLAMTIPSKRHCEESRTTLRDLTPSLTKLANYPPSAHSYAKKMAQKAPTPSAAAKPHGMRFQQAEYPIHNGVPYERTGHYVSIYSRALGALKDAIRNPSEEPLSADLLQKIHSFIYDSATLYESEDPRRKKMILHLQDILKRHVHERYRIEGAELDGIIFQEYYGGIVPFLCVDVKDTVGSGADGAYQGACGWRKFIVQNETTFRKTCSPSVIISIMGPYINISGAVFAREFIVESFTGYIFLGGGVSMDDRVIEVARIFRAISVALNELEAEYDVSKTSNAVLMMPRPGFRDADAPELQFVKRLFEDDEHNAKAMFLAKLQEKDVLVKFTHRYNGEAHRALDSEGRAPTLHFVGDIVGGLKMVVMEYIDGETVHDLEGRNRLLPANAYEDFKRALELLHQQGIVHGDYRMANLLVKDGRGYVVDFDWCGKHSEARYPPTLNDFDIVWADGVARGSLMMKEHDCHLFSKLLEEVGVEN
ncbi:hypothetical protein ACEPAF_1605 [Sanghuangporus sanghuang]